MYVAADSLDDLLHKLYPKLLKSKMQVSSTRGDSKELDGVLLSLSKPRMRLSRTESRGRIFSSLGELIWYLSGSDKLDFIRYYIRNYEQESEDGVTIRGAYGPRLYGLHDNNQIDNILRILKEKPTTRRAVIQIYDAADISRNYREIPCTCTLQFIIRDKFLHMYTNMRSNDAFIGLPHDVFCFTMLQELFANSLGVKLGTYKHFVGSLHIYTHHIRGAHQFLNEGWQDQIAMPPMPAGDPWGAVQTLVRAESLIRGGQTVDLDELAVAPYWKDLIRLLQIFHRLKTKSFTGLSRLKGAMTNDVYEAYIRKRMEVHSEQLEIEGTTAMKSP